MEALEYKKFAYLYWTNILTTDQIKNLNNTIKRNINKIDNKSLKDDPADHVHKNVKVQGIKYKYLKKHLSHCISEIYDSNNKNWNYNVYKEFDDSVLLFNTYNSKNNSTYDWHYDGDDLKDQDIKLTALINISDKDYSGGEFKLLNKSYPETVIEFNQPGSMIIFKSHILHKVEPVTKGVRKTLTYFLYGPNFI